MEARRIYKMWATHREFFKRSRHHFPSEMEARARSSFVRFVDKTLKLNMPSHMVDRMTEKVKLARFRKTWPGRKVRHYKAEMVNTVPKLTVIETTFPKLSNKSGEGYFTVRGILKDDVRRALVIKPSKTCLFRGFSPFPVGFQPQKFYGTDARFWRYLKTTRVVDRVSLEEFDRIGISGSWPTQYQDFQILCDPTPHEACYSDFMEAMRARVHLIKLPSCPAPTAQDIRRCETNRKADPGLLSSMYFGNSHARADKFLKPIAEWLFEVSGVTVTCDTSIYKIGGRNRNQKINVDKPLRSRSLVMPEGPAKIFQLSYASKVYDGLKYINWDDASNEIRIGQSDFHGNYAGQFSEMEGCEVFETDLSCHDGRCVEENMVLAFGMLRACFPKSDTIDKHFMFFMSGIVFKNVVVPGRGVYRVLKGMPTGTPFGSIITTLVNWLNWAVVLNKNYCKVALTGIACRMFGDDTKILFKDWVSQPMDASMLAGEMTRWSGQVCSPFLFASLGDALEDRPSFLKTVPLGPLPAKLLTVTLGQCAFVRARNGSNKAYAKIVSGLFYSAPFNPDTLLFLQGFREYLWSLDPPDARFPIVNTYEERIQSRSLRFTLDKCRRLYMTPLLYPWEVSKDVDLGNKPKLCGPEKLDHDVLLNKSNFVSSMYI